MEDPRSHCSHFVLGKFRVGAHTIETKNPGQCRFIEFAEVNDDVTRIFEYRVMFHVLKRQLAR